MRTPAQHVLVVINGTTILQGSAAVLISGGVTGSPAQPPGTGTSNVQQVII